MLKLLPTYASTLLLFLLISTPGFTVTVVQDNVNKSWPPASVQPKIFTDCLSRLLLLEWVACGSAEILGKDGVEMAFLARLFPSLLHCELHCGDKDWKGLWSSMTCCHGQLYHKNHKCMELQCLTVAGSVLILFSEIFSVFQMLEENDE